MRTLIAVPNSEQPEPIVRTSETISVRYDYSGVLDVSDLDIGRVDPSVGQLVQLTGLNCSSNQLTTLPDTIGNLVNLTVFSCNGNQLTTLPDAIGYLYNLTVFSCNGNQLTTLPDAIGYLYNLTVFSCNGNQLTILPDIIGNLYNLTVFSCNGNQLTILPDIIGNLYRLTQLSCGSNQLTILPDTIGHLVNLTQLSCEVNQLTVLPDTIGNLVNLTELSCNGNQLTTLPDSIGNLANLTTLNCNDNQLATLLRSIDLLSNLVHLKCDEVVRENLPDIVKERLRAAAAWDDVCAQTDELVQWGRCKLMCVGPGRAGKTQLIRTLLGDDFQEEKDSKSTIVGDVKVNLKVTDDKWVPSTTSAVMEMACRVVKQHETEFNTQTSKSKPKTQPPPTIDQTARQMLPPKVDAPIALAYNHTVMSNVKGEGLSFTIYDFGGQDVFRAVHHMFLTSYGIYLVVFNMAKLIDPKDETEMRSLRFWYGSTRLNAPEAPVMLVGTHCDLLKDGDLEKVADKVYDVVYGLGTEEANVNIIESESLDLRSEGDGLFFVLSNKTRKKEQVDAIQTSLVDKAREQDFVKEKIPLKWANILETILSTNGKQVWSFDSIRDVSGTMNDKDIRKMLWYFNQLGVLLYWGPDGNEEAREDDVLAWQVIQQPQWLMDRIGMVIHHDVLHTKGDKIQKLFQHCRKEYAMYQANGIASKILLKVLWEEDYKFMLALMKEEKLMCDWLGSEVNAEFLVPSLFRIADGYTDECVPVSVDKFEEFWKSQLDDKKRNGQIPLQAKFVCTPCLRDALFESLVCSCIQDGANKGSKLAPSMTFLQALCFPIDDKENQLPVMLKCVPEDDHPHILVTTFSDSNAFGKRTVQWIKGLLDALVEGTQLEVKLLISGSIGYWYTADQWEPNPICDDYRVDVDRQQRSKEYLQCWEAQQPVTNGTEDEPVDVIALVTELRQDMDTVKSGMNAIPGKVQKMVNNPEFGPGLWTISKLPSSAMRWVSSRFWKLFKKQRYGIRVFCQLTGECHHTDLIKIHVPSELLLKALPYLKKSLKLLRKATIVTTVTKVLLKLVALDGIELPRIDEQWISAAESAVESIKSIENKIGSTIDGVSDTAEAAGQQALEAYGDQGEYSTDKFLQTDEWDVAEMSDKLKKILMKEYPVFPKNAKTLTGLVQVVDDNGNHLWVANNEEVRKQAKDKGFVTLTQRMNTTM